MTSERERTDDSPSPRSPAARAPHGPRAAAVPGAAGANVSSDDSQGNDPSGGSRAKLSRSMFTLPADRIRAPRPTPGAETTPVASDVEAARRGRPADYQTVKGRLHERLLDELDRQRMLGETEEALAEFVGEFVARVLATEDLPLNEAERRSINDELLEETLGVGPLAPLMADPAVTDVLVNRYDQIYIERFGRLEKVDVRFRDPEHLVRIIQRIAARVGRRIDESSPMVDARLPDGSRVNATLPPATLNGPTLSIRRFGRSRLRREDLVRLGMFSADIWTFLDVAVRARKNLLISGGTGAGKSTFLGALAEAVPPTERIITIEDAAELILDQEHVIRMETRPANIEGRGRITQRDLLVNSLRMRPDRIIVGEVRGPEALDMLQAMNTGHDGGLTTIHANSPRDALARLETMVLMAGVDLPSRAIREQTVAALDYIVQIRRYEDGVRRVECVSELTGLEGETPQLQDLFRFERRGFRGRTIEGRFVATGVVPRIVEELRARQMQMPLEIFRPEGARS